MSTEKYEYKLPKGYYITAIVFIFATLIELLNTSSTEGQLLINLGFYQTYVSFIGLALCKAYIYNLSIYGLLKNKLWGLFSTTSVSLYALIISIRDMLDPRDYPLSIQLYRYVQLFIFLLIFGYLTSVLIKKLKNYLEI